MRARASSHQVVRCLTGHNASIRFRCISHKGSRPASPCSCRESIPTHVCRSTKSVLTAASDIGSAAVFCRTARW